MTRSPKTHLFAHGKMKFSKVNGVLHYQLAIWSDDGMHFINNQKVKVPDELFVKDIGSCITFDDIQNVIAQHSQLKVLQN